MPGARLRVVGHPAGAELTVDDELVVGREVPGPGGFPTDSQLSRRHARFRFGEGGWLLVEDLGSSNGTAVNGRRIDGPTFVRVGDQVQLGGTTIEVVHIDESPPAAGPVQGPAPDLRRTVRLPTPPAPPQWAGAPAPVPKPAADPVVAAPATPLAPAGPDDSKRRRPFPWAVTCLIVLVVVLAAAIGGYGAGHSRAKTKPAAPSPAAAATGATAVPAAVLGTVYVESNVARPGANSILAYHYRDGGNLQPLQIAEYPTGGAGSADLTDSGVLDADQHIIVSADGGRLFAVNQGSDSIAVFNIDRAGTLSPVPGSPFASGGKAPASVGLSGNRLVVVNKAQDGLRDLSNEQPNYSTFIVHSDGSLAPTGSTVAAPAGFSPTQALITPGGNVVISSEEGGPFRAFTLGADGTLTQGPNSPLSPPDSIYPPNFPASQKWALGLGVHPTQKLLYAQMATIGQMAVYRYDDTGRLTFLSAAPNPGAMLPCWTLVSRDGTKVYTDNAGNNSVSVYDTSDPLNPRQIQLLPLKGDGNPWDLHFDPTGQFIFMVDPRARMNVKPGDGNQIHTLRVGSDGRLSEPDYSPVSIPVARDVNPVGLAVVARA